MLTCGVRHPMISRVSNDLMRARTGQPPLTAILLQRQLALYGKAARESAGDPLRDSVFIPGTLTPVADAFARKVGAPRLEWAKFLGPPAHGACGEGDRLQDLVQDPLV
eukprot:4812766-Pyramimonas_sp.AAC.1